MEADDATLISTNSRKRPRSLSVTPAAETDDLPMIGMDAEVTMHLTRQSKRQRKANDVPSYDALPDEHVLKRMDRSNPLSRRNLKKEAKRVRKANRGKDQPGQGPGVMDVDVDGLQFTFMA